MAKEKKAKKGDQPAATKPKKIKKAAALDGAKPAKSKAKKNGKGSVVAHPLEALNRLADHPLVSELIAVGALAAVAAVAEAGSRDTGAVKSAASAKKAGKAAAAAIGARLLKEFSGSALGTKDKAKALPSK